MKRILTSLLLMITLSAKAQDEKNYGRYTTLRLGVTAGEFVAQSNKIVTALCRYEFKTQEITDAMRTTVLGRFNTDSFVATVNTNIAVYVYDCPVQKAGNIFSWADLAKVKEWVDNNPKIAVDWIRDDQRDAFDEANGISKKEVVEP